MKLWTVIFAILALVIEKGHSLKCYKCENCEHVSDIEPISCETPHTANDEALGRTSLTTSLPPTTELESTTLEAITKYACFKINIHVNGETTKIRNCISFAEGTDPCVSAANTIESTHPNGKPSGCEHCFEDGCNSSVALRLSVVVVFGIVILKLLF